jgi:hypothetical protein
MWLLVILVQLACFPVPVIPTTPLMQASIDGKDPSAPYFVTLVLLAKKGAAARRARSW